MQAAYVRDNIELMQDEERRITRINRDNLLLIYAAIEKRLGRRGGQNYLAILLGHKAATHLSAVKHGKRYLGPELKERIEGLLNRPKDWMDRDDHGDTVETLALRVPLLPNVRVESTPRAEKLPKPRNQFERWVIEQLAPHASDPASKRNNPK